MPQDLSFLDCIAQAELVRRGEAKPLELVEAAIARAERVDSRLGAIVSAQFERARTEAAAPGLPAGPFRGVLSLPISSLRSASPVLRNPFNRGKAITLTLDQFKYGWANALSDEEARRTHRARSGR